MSRRVLLLLSQMPHDPASGAARSMRTMAELLAGAGFSVTALGTTATESGVRASALDRLRGMGLDVDIDRGPALGRGRPVLRAEDRGVAYTLLDTGAHPWNAWERAHGRQFGRLFRDQLERFDPEILLTFGGRPEEVARRSAARRHGCTIVFGLRNTGYLDPRAFAEVDAVITPSRFLSERYRATIGLESTHLPSPLDLEDVIAPGRESIFFTFVNPSRAKGVMLFARLAEEVSRRRPDIPFLVIEARGTTGTLVRAGLDGGFDLRRHENVMISPGTMHPREIYAGTRVLLVPSVVEEASGRVAAEALANGIPPIVSDRGGLAETCAGAGFTVPLSRDLTPETAEPVAPADVAGWAELVVRLADDESCYEACSNRAREAGTAYTPARLAPRYVEFFEQVRRTGGLLSPAPVNPRPCSPA